MQLRTDGRGVSETEAGAEAHAAPLDAVDRATVHDAQQMCDLINFWAARGDMLPRSIGETYENLRDFFVIRDELGVAACVALHISWLDLAEIKSLAVREDLHSGGHGSSMVQACIEEGRALGLGRLFALTSRPGFFERLGFGEEDVMSLPRKVWNECYRCPKFPGCNEIAMTLDLHAAAAASAEG